MDRTCAAQHARLVLEKNTAVWWWLVTGAFAGLGACNASSSGGAATDGGGQNVAECVSCGEAECPDQAAACDASANCSKLRSCSLACTTDSCKNDCLAE